MGWRRLAVADEEPRLELERRRVDGHPRRQRVAGARRPERGRAGRQRQRRAPARQAVHHDPCPRAPRLRRRAEASGAGAPERQRPRPTAAARSRQLATPPPLEQQPIEPDRRARQRQAGMDADFGAQPGAAAHRTPPPVPRAAEPDRRSPPRLRGDCAAADSGAATGLWDEVPAVGVELPGVLPDAQVDVVAGRAVEGPRRLRLARLVDAVRPRGDRIPDPVHDVVRERVEDACPPDRGATPDRRARHLVLLVLLTGHLEILVGADDAPRRGRAGAIADVVVVAVAVVDLVAVGDRGQERPVGPEGEALVGGAFRAGRVERPGSARVQLADEAEHPAVLAYLLALDQHRLVYLGHHLGELVLQPGVGRLERAVRQRAIPPGWPRERTRQSTGAPRPPGPRVRRASP